MGKASLPFCAAVPVVAGPSPSASRLQSFMRCQRRDFVIGGCGFERVTVRNERRGDVALSSGPWRDRCQALEPDSNEDVTPAPASLADQTQVWYFAVANAQSLMSKRPRDLWLVMEPSFLNQHPGLKELDTRLIKPTAAILSTNGDWMLSVVKKNLPQAAIGKFVAPSAAVPDPLKSNVNVSGALIGGGVWHLETIDGSKALFEAIMVEAR